MTEFVFPYIPEFSHYKERNKWIVDNAQYFTVILRRDLRNYRAERFTLEEAIALANQVLEQYPHASPMIYAVAGGHDTLTATVSKEKGIQRHE
jgi:hypothetical protein